MKTVITTLSLLLIMSLLSCEETDKENNKTDAEKPSHVELRKTDGKYRLFVNGEEFFVNGAGCEYGPCYLVAAHGGNAIRTWRTNNSQKSGLEVLNEARENGLMVMMGLDVGLERHGFDYNDSLAVAQQLERLKGEVLALKDHPALLGWGIGNELNHRYTNPNVWYAVNDIANMIKEVDGNHVVTTMLANLREHDVEYISERAPSLDFLSIQMYADIINLEERLKNSGYNGPYLVTEWGATGHWEVALTSWGSAIEQTSTEKAEVIMQRYKKAILADETNCLGSFIFLWGQKQERTPSWYGLFTENGEKTEPINVMEYFWTGEWPENMAPRLHDISINGKGGRYDNVFLTAGNAYTLTIKVEHEDMSTLSVRAEIMPEPTELSDGGDYEPRPTSIEGLIISADTSEILFRAPIKNGPYRLLVYVLDEHNHAATGNIPFFIN